MSVLRDVMPKDSDCKLGIVLNMEVQHPYGDSSDDEYAAQIQDGIYNRWFADAVFRAEYPSDVLEHLTDHMPEGWQDDMAGNSQPMDWLGLNYYTRNMIKHDGSDVFPFGAPVQSSKDESDPKRTSMNWEIYPEGLTYFLRRIQDRYDPKIPLIVSENGMAWHDRVIDDAVTDTKRVGYFDQHLDAVLKAIEAGADVQGYFAWSLLDNFEWAFGYDERFGIIHVDFETQKRTPKASWHWWQELLG